MVSYLQFILIKNQLDLKLATNSSKQGRVRRFKTHKKIRVCKVAASHLAIRLKRSAVLIIVIQVRRAWVAVERQNFSK